MLNNPALYLLAFSQLTIGLVFAWSSVAKLLDLQAFERTIMQFHPLPKPLVRVGAASVLTAEITVAALMLWGGRVLMVGFPLALLLLISFCLVLASLLARKVTAPCHCFGASTKSVSRYDIARNIGFMVWAFIGWAIVLAQPGLPTNFHWAETTFLAAIAAAFVVLCIHLDSIVVLLRAL